MTPTKLLIGQILVVFAIVVAGVWTATQWAAAMLAYQPELGTPWFIIFHMPIYQPWAIFPWWYHYDAYAPHVFERAGAMAGASGFVGCGAAIFGSLWRARQQRHVTTYGSARWAEVREMERAGLLGDAGAFLGRHHGRYLRHDGPEHVMAFLIAQSLNQIEKAYGEHNSILDNCHVRVAFATNDERTARRISDALGTATEQRSMRNYAGHRLAPWLAHVMVSRQETARPLLTPGEVMQLPPADELVLVSGLAPIRAQKLRYYEDRNFRVRVMAPPELIDGRYADRPQARSNDWGRLARRPDARLARAEDATDTVAEGGGLEQQRHPGLAEEASPKPQQPKQLDLLAADQDEGDLAADQRAMDRARGLSAVARGYGIDEAGGRDLLPGL